MSYFATDADIGGAHFNGLTVPGNKTIVTARNTSYKDRSQARVMKALGKKTTDDVPNDDYGTLKEAFLYLYGLLLKGHSLYSKAVSTILTNMLGLDKDAVLVVTNKWYSMYGNKFGRDHE